MLTCPAARLMMAAGIKNGEILRGPPLSKFVCSRSMMSNPPIPEPMCTPTRSAISGVMFRPDIFVGNLNVEGLFKCHHKFDCIERVSAQVVHERRVRGDFAFIDAKLLHNNLFNLLVYCGHSRSSLFWGVTATATASFWISCCP